MARRPAIRAKVRAYLAARERGKSEYMRADKILDELILKMKVDEEVPFDATKRRAKLVDNFAEADGNTVYRAHGIKRFEIKVLD